MRDNCFVVNRFLMRPGCDAVLPRGATVCMTLNEPAVFRERLI